MADDRVHIKCDGCGAWKMLTKYFSGTPYTTDNGILEWIDSHGDCHPNAYQPDLGGIPGFSLHTEDKVGSVLDPEKQNVDGPTMRALKPQLDL